MIQRHINKEKCTISVVYPLFCPTSGYIRQNSLRPLSRNSKRRARVIKQPTTKQGNRRCGAKNYDEKFKKKIFNGITNGNTSNSFGQKS
jgi:hypothetical protein